MQVKESAQPIVIQLSDIIAERLDGFERKVMYSPVSGGSSYMKFVIVHGQPGAAGLTETSAAGEMSLTLKGTTQLTANGLHCELPAGTAVSIPGGVKQKSEVVGNEQWIALKASCDECPLMLEKLAHDQASGATPQDATAAALIVRRLDDIVPENLYGFERKVMFSPTVGGSSTIKFAIVHGKPGAKSIAHTHPGGELALTLAGQARLTVNDKCHDLSAGSALSVPPDVKHPSEAVGGAEWVVATTYCDECPLMRTKRTRDRKAERQVEAK